MYLNVCVVLFVGVGSLMLFRFTCRWTFSFEIGPIFKLSLNLRLSQKLLQYVATT